MVRSGLNALMVKDFMNVVGAVQRERPELPREIIWKDFMVFAVLKDLATGSHPGMLSDLSERIVFKGGTSLSKAFKLIERFSEDIDLALLMKVDGLTEITKTGRDRYLSELLTHVQTFPYLREVDSKAEVKTKGKKAIDCGFPLPWAEDAGYVRPNPIALSLK
ncbi:MAG: hypothetical protein EOP04_03675, partial [Proteobacteria bacterium]